tara:strand:- start:8499 stop:10934 length:2436 start_codon:yes stop_codon:yes gene_type:complete
MKISLSWLKKYLPSLEATPDQLEEVFPLMGLEVESVETTGIPQLDNVVVGEILTRDQHPDADRLSVCQVSVGGAEPVQIVCGAQNHKVGDRVPVALVGAVLPGDFKIKPSKLRGVPSAGMMCSPSELNLPGEPKGLLILEDKPEIGTPINSVFAEGDIVFDLEVTPNRGDSLSHIGVARDLAAWYDLQLVLPELTCDPETAAQPTAESLLKEVRIDAAACPYYTAWSIQGVKLGPSPDWMQADLQALGLRPINNVVDITNWVMLECGQPLHAFDSAKIQEQTLLIRQATKGEKLTTLDEKERTLSEDMMVIADKNRSLVVAGVMGSLDAEVDDNTQDIVLESAYFNPGSIRKTSRSLILSTDSSYRFVRDVDPAGVVFAARRAIDLILEIAGGKLVGPGVIVGGAPRADRVISVTPNFIQKKCGFAISEEQVQATFERLGFTVDTSAEAWQVTVPSFRSEVDRPIDLVEEFLRIYGTANIPKTDVSLRAIHRRNDGLANFNTKASEYLCGQHFNECYHYSLRDEDTFTKWYSKALTQGLALANPLTSEQSHLRPSLIPGLLDALKLNNSRGNGLSPFFELGRTFTVHSGKLYECASVAFVLPAEAEQLPWQSGSGNDFYKVKGLVQQLVNLAGLKADRLFFESCKDAPAWEESHAGTVGSIAREQFTAQVGLVSLQMTKDWDIPGPVFAGEISFLPRVFERAAKASKFSAFSLYPPVTKDLALLVSESSLAETVRKDLAKVAREHVGKSFNVEAVSAFDVYQGKGLPEGKKSLAFRIHFRSNEKTLTDNEVGTVFDNIQQVIKEKTDYAIR